MHYVSRLLSIALAAFVWPAAFMSDIAQVVFDYMPSFRPEACESIALDRVARPVAILPALRSRFRAFIDGARSHADFTAGHFDPGRLAA